MRCRMLPPGDYTVAVDNIKIGKKKLAVNLKTVDGGVTIKETFMKQKTTKQTEPQTFNLSDFNPDHMSQAELMAWADHIGPGLRPQAAVDWDVAYDVARNMRHYCINKYTANWLRVEGKVERALVYEDICQRIYSTLPKEVRW